VDTGKLILLLATVFFKFSVSYPFAVNLNKAAPTRYICNYCDVYGTAVLLPYCWCRLCLDNF